MDHLQQLQKEFINLRFGTFIHFNSATMQFAEGNITDWEYDCENNGLPRNYPFSPASWNPDMTDCRQWASVAADAGCRFAALTAKHHEGFALWPTAYSDHSVKNAAYNVDIVAEYLKAFREANLSAGLYFSILDLTEGIGQRSCTERQKEYIKGQITELLTNYGPIPFLIVDGWNAPWGGPDYDMLPFEELNHHVKTLQPDCLLMNIGCFNSLSGTDILFYENAAGQEWESSFAGPALCCDKLTDSWFWRSSHTKAALSDIHWVQDKMKKYFAADCNFMLNLSPNIHGRIDQNLADAFAQIGKNLCLPAPLNKIPDNWLHSS